MSPERIGERSHRLSGLAWLCIALVVIGAINWGLVGLFNFNLVNAIFGGYNALTRIIYVIVAIAGLYLLADSIRMQRPTRPA